MTSGTCTPRGRGKDKQVPSYQQLRSIQALVDGLVTRLCRGRAGNPFRAASYRRDRASTGVENLCMHTPSIVLA
jgi:hypothetical protein